jgi:phospholipid/cholesterol/gamma-HCH transport system permease protein
LRWRAKGACLSDAAASEPHAWYRTERRQNILRVAFGGDWITDEAAFLDEQLRALGPISGDVELDGSGIRRLDSTGAWLMVRTRRQIEHQGARVVRFAYPPLYAPLFDVLQKPAPSSAKRGTKRPLLEFLEQVGRNTTDVLYQGYRLLGFVGRVTVETIEAVLRPDRELPWPSFFRQIEQTGVTAVPIVSLLAFLLGVVLAYQGADQLRRFGAELLTVNLVGTAMLREVGCLITAIVVAGRSGSAFTAQIGTMKLNQEIDAMRTIGLDPVEVLVLPRLFGLIVALPLLTFVANIMGLIGGAIMCSFYLGITFPAFARQLYTFLTMNTWTFWLGLIKAPVFAAIIALVGCFEGLRVQGNAGSVGSQTTRSVVEAIFLVIVFDASFSILFSLLGI